MLGNQADQFFNTPMNITIAPQPSRSMEMPAPRQTARVGDAAFLPGIGNMTQAFMPGIGDGAFIPGIGSDFMPGMAGTCAGCAPGIGMMEWAKSNKTLLAVAAAAALLFTKPGKTLLKRVGLG